MIEWSTFLTSVGLEILICCKMLMHSLSHLSFLLTCGVQGSTRIVFSLYMLYTTIESSMMMSFLAFLVTTSMFLINWPFLSRTQCSL